MYYYQRPVLARGGNTLNTAFAVRFAKLASFSLIAALCAGALHQDSFLLRKKFVENSEDVYRIETRAQQTITNPLAGEQQFSFSGSMKYTLKTGKVDGE